MVGMSAIRAFIYVIEGAVALANFFAGRQPCFLLKWHQKRLRFRRHSL